MRKKIVSPNFDIGKFHCRYIHGIIAIQQKKFIDFQWQVWNAWIAVKKLLRETHFSLARYKGEERERTQTDRKSARVLQLFARDSRQAFSSWGSNSSITRPRIYKKLRFAWFKIKFCLAFYCKHVTKFKCLVKFQSTNHQPKAQF